MPAPASTVIEAAPPPAPLGAPWGTAGPVSLVAASPDRSWVALCQARADTNGDGRISVEVGAQGELRGDRLDGYFVGQPGAGTRIDAFGGADPSGRYVALVTGGKLVLVDRVARLETTLGEGLVDLRDDRSSFVHPRCVAFDPTGRRLLYLRKRGDFDDVAVRNLASGVETVVVPGDGDLWRADFDPSGDWIVLRMIATDTNGNGRLEWPVPVALEPFMRCTGPLPRFAAWEHPGDDVTARVAPAEGGPAVDAPGLVVPFGDSLVERDADGALALAKPGGGKTELAKKSCAAKLLYAEPTHGVLVTTCVGKKGHGSDVRIHSHGAEKSLGLVLSAPAGDHFGGWPSRLLPLYPGSDTTLVDVDTGDATNLTPGDRVVAAVGDHALVLRDRSLVLYTRGAPEQTLATAVDPLSHMQRAGAVVAIAPVVVDVEKGEVLGAADARALAVARDGAVLTASGSSADATRMAVGPLTWDKR